MLKRVLFILVFLVMLISITSCLSSRPNILPTESTNQTTSNEDLGTDDDSFGSSLDDSGIYDGVFEGESNIEVKYVSGTNNAYTIENNTIKFTNINKDSVYSIKGQFKGNILIDVSDKYNFDLELDNVSIISTKNNPIIIKNGNKVTIKANKNTKNYIYDERSTIDENDDSLYSGAIISFCDLEIGGKGELNIVSKNNNGIHSKDDLVINNLTLSVACLDNAIKGNDSITIEGANITAIASIGDAIKTTNSDISSKGNQRGNVVINSGNVTLYSACDGIDAAHNVIVNGGNLNIYTDKYSNYSSVVSSNKEGTYYLKTTTSTYKYSIKYMNSEEDYLWVDAEYKSSYRDGRTTYYYYTFTKNTKYDKLKVYTYKQVQESKQDKDYLYVSELLSANKSYDTIQIKTNSYSWTNYTIESRPGGFGGPGGGFNDGNTDKKDISTKGIKSYNEIVINNGNINIKSYDDSLHTNNESELENGKKATGNLIINNGNLNLYSNDDGIHASSTLEVNGGNINITNSYEGVEGNIVNINGGNISIISKDDGINATLSSGEAIKLNSGYIYIYAGGDGIDSNSKSSYNGIIFDGADVVVISTSSMNSAIDTETGYTYNKGRVVAIMPSGGMSNESTHCKNFSNYGIKSNVSIKENSYLTVDDLVVVKTAISMSSLVVYLGANNAKISVVNEINKTLDYNGVYWK